MDNKPVLIVNNMSVKNRETTHLSNIHFEIQRGEVVTLIGPNGAGKTTLLGAITGDRIYQTGSISFNGKDLKTWQGQQRAQHIAALAQINQLSFPFLVEEVVALGRIPHSTGKILDQSIIESALQELDIQHLRKRIYTQLSGGEQQRTQLARVFAQIWRHEDGDPRLLILDEPVISLDLGHQHSLLNTIKQFSSNGVSILMVLHDMNLAANYSDKIIALGAGNQVAIGTPEETFTEAVLNPLFNTQVYVTRHPVTGKTVVLS